ncbi:hypothetical protein KBY97_08115 [Synechococcus sp. ATX 2A4]|uniref:hypothetical protein n=1 Tax=Synechococcus sp. ATX 2A4 TaxID=2823727 RepID=UPI0020CFB4F6|nr:hypothetical protein [Synechococcus sp. ATX 2A4]MCP9885089.1 hypothetical protein [Synechococcus sp. ATX 2A4]
MRLLSPLSEATLAFDPMLGRGQSVPTSTEATTTNTAKETSTTSQIAANTDAAETPSINDVPSAILTENGIAIRSADPVAYFKNNRYIPGSAN